MPRAARRRADGAIEPGRAQPVEKAPIHASAVEEAHGAGVAIGQDRLGPELGRDGCSDGRRFRPALRPR